MKIFVLGDSDLVWVQRFNEYSRYCTVLDFSKYQALRKSMVTLCECILVHMTVDTLNSETNRNMRYV